MGFANVVALASGASSLLSRRAGFLIGSVLSLTVLWMDRKHRRNNEFPGPCMPLILALSPAFFSARTYDLVFLIPAFAWLVSTLAQARGLASLAIALCTLFLIPQQAMHLLYDYVLAGTVPASLFAFTLAPFRSWTLLALILISFLLLMDRR